MINELALPDFGAGFTSTGGRITQQPPALGAKYQLFVPKPDTDGLDIAGIRTMEVAAPTATITGWALRAAGHREGDLCGLSGSYRPVRADPGGTAGEWRSSAIARGALRRPGGIREGG